MRPSPFRDLRLLREGLSRLLRRPALFAGLVLLSTGLTGLAPLLRSRIPLPPDPMVDGLVRGLALLPMELYALPRLAAYLDAETLDHAGNPRSGWQEAFETRWWRATASRLLLSLMVGIGLALCLVPGLFVLAAFGWGPTRTLLRGEGILEGYRGGARLMASGAWNRAVLVVGAALLLQLLLLLPVAALTAAAGLSLATLRRPAFWLESLLSGALGIWFASVLLALFQALEADAGKADQPSGK
jgi:hypothetical protein